MIIFGNVKRLTYNTTSFPITLADIKFHSKWFQTNPTDTSLDTYITQFILPKVVAEFENFTGYLIQDQTYKATIRSLQTPIIQKFEAPLIHLNVRSVNDVLYLPCDWNGSDAKTTLATENYIWLNEEGTTPKTFQLKACYLDFYEVQNNFETSYSAGFENNDFTDLPQDIKDALAMHGADLIDIKQELCGCEGVNSPLIDNIYRKYEIDRKSCYF